MKKRIPRTTSNFGILISQDYYYVDRTQYIEKLESLSGSFVFFLRPRKFGKTLFLSLLEHYYGLEYAERYETLFTNLYSGTRKTQLASSFYVLKFDFSAIRTDSPEITFREFTQKVRMTVSGFLKYYNLFSDKERDEILQNESPNLILSHLFTTFRASGLKSSIYILIDEYDHFTNELLSFNSETFKTMVGSTGFVRKFYESIKDATAMGVVTRLFATGVTPITLDSLTSGFNIATDITLHEDFNGMLGFTEKEVAEIVDYYEVSNTTKVLADMRVYYNGSLFSRYASERLYNSTMVFYFLDSIYSDKRYPTALADANIASDYQKIESLLRLVPGKEIADTIEKLITTGVLTANLTMRFTLEKQFTIDDMVSLLFYHGLLTLKGVRETVFDFEIPNYAIKELYWNYLSALYEKSWQVGINADEVRESVLEFARTSNPDFLIAAIEAIMKKLSNRDLMNFNEKTLKILTILCLVSANVYVIESEVEVDKRYIDLVLTKKEGFTVKDNFLIELKYIKKSEHERLEEVTEQALEQIKNYHTSFNRKEQYVPIAIVFVGEVGEWREVIGERTEGN